jgi:isopenicillin N synthase-like dioxygenase
MTVISGIPVIDLDPARDDPRLADEFRDAYGRTGFGYIRNHGIDPGLIEDVFEASRRFHALPLTEKMQVAVNRAHRGYIPIDTATDVNSTLAEVTRPNQSASFMMMHEDACADPVVYLSGPNQRPGLPGFREALAAYDTAMRKLGTRLMRIALMAAGAEDLSFMSAFRTPTTWLRLLHYPPRPEGTPGDFFGAAPHTDFGCLTLLVQDAVGGLQVQDATGRWLDAPCRPGTFVVNVGDMLHRLSNGRLRSTPHRVINRSAAEHYSCPYFFDPHVNARIVPLPGTGTPRFKPLKYADFLRHELESAYVAHAPFTSTGGGTVGGTEGGTDGFPP